MAELLTLYHDHVRPEWIDYNGHMNDGYYAVAFGLATEQVQDFLGMDADYRVRTKGTLYTVEAHLNYLHELKEGDPIMVTAMLLGVDNKRIHLFEQMYHEEEGYLAATMEFMFLHVDQGLGRSAPIPPDILTRLQTLEAAHAQFARPPQVGRRISM
ncbi:MAG: thioesterase family protein [Anaerolineales bacterium]|nr:thioesterase family protein [Anaerolineales bacterium]